MAGPIASLRAAMAAQPGLLTAAIAVFFLVLGAVFARQFDSGGGALKPGFDLYVGKTKNGKKAASPRQRWLWDSRDLLREGYAKVS